MNTRRLVEQLVLIREDNDPIVKWCGVKLMHINEDENVLSYLSYREAPFFNNSTCNVIYMTVKGHVCTLNHIIQDIIQFMSCFVTFPYFYIRVLYYTHHFHCNGDCFRHSKRHYYFYLPPSVRYW